MQTIEDLNKALIESKDYTEVSKDYLVSILSDTDKIILIRAIFVYKGEKSFFKGSKKEITSREFVSFLKDEVNPYWDEDYIVIINNDVYYINEEGVISHYFQFILDDLDAE